MEGSLSEGDSALRHFAVMQASHFFDDERRSIESEQQSSFLLSKKQVMGSEVSSGPDSVAQLQDARRQKDAVPATEEK